MVDEIANRVVTAGVNGLSRNRCAATRDVPADDAARENVDDEGDVDEAAHVATYVKSLTQSCDFRHSYATWLAEQTRDDRVVQKMLMDSSLRQVRRYSEGATAARVRAVIERRVAGAFVFRCSGRRNPINSGGLKQCNSIVRCARQ
jgi:hypothetical protein